MGGEEAGGGAGRAPGQASGGGSGGGCEVGTPASGGDEVAALGSYEGVTYAFCSLDCSREFDKAHGDYFVPPPEAS